MYLFLSGLYIDNGDMCPTVHSCCVVVYRNKAAEHIKLHSCVAPRQYATTDTKEVDKFRPNNV